MNELNDHMIEFGRRCHKVYDSFKEKIEAIKIWSREETINDVLKKEMKTSLEIEEKMHEADLNRNLDISLSMQKIIENHLFEALKLYDEVSKYKKINKDYWSEE